MERMDPFGNPVPPRRNPVKQVAEGALTIARRFPFWTLVGVVALFGFLFRDFISGNVTDLKVGDCFDLPTAAAMAQGKVKDVQHHPCTDIHGGEVILIGKVPGASDAYPDVTGFDQFAVDQCVTAYTSYTGRDFRSEKVYDVSYLYPTKDGWARGDHTMECYVHRGDQQPYKGSLRKK